MRSLRNVTCGAVQLLAAILILGACWSVAPAVGQGVAQTVRLTIDYGDGTTKTINDLPWTKGSTVLDAMTAAAGRPHGISFGYTGAGATTILTKIDDVQNQGGGAGRKNWQYWVTSTRDNHTNIVYGDRSFAVFELQANDAVLWQFATESGKTRE